jgi:antitoxin (DNA-binding transcriptional repressor) of toxin-antitoxin stability system
MTKPGLPARQPTEPIAEPTLVASKVLRRYTHDMIVRVAAGETLFITIHQRPVVKMIPLRRRRANATKAAPTPISATKLRTDTADIFHRVQAGEEFVVTISGEPTIEIVAVAKLRARV